MKLQRIETFVVANPPPRQGGRYFIFVRLTTGCGITGVGEIYNATFGPHLVAAMAEESFARHFAGADPHDVETLFRRAYGAGYTMRPDVTAMGVFSGLEMACWDIVGKAAGQPVHKLLGGRVHDRLRSYTYLYPAEGDVYPAPGAPNVYTDPELAAETALRAVEAGFTAVKFDPAGPYTIWDGHQPRLEDLDRTEAFCRAIRAAVGPRADLLVGTHGQFTASGAARLARRIAPYDPLWFEEPVPPDDPEAMALVARATPVPIAAGERLTTRTEFARLLRIGAASILQMNLGRVGGLLEAKKIAGMAEAFGAQIAPHLYCGPVVLAANVQLAAASPNFLILETIGRCDGPFMEFVDTALRWEAGDVIPPEAPGLGIALRDEALAAHPYTGDALHLEPGTDPVRP